MDFGDWWSAKTSETVQTRYRDPGKGQLKEKTGFLVSRSLALPSAPPWAGRVIWWGFLIKNKRVEKGSEDAGNDSVMWVEEPWMYREMYGFFG